MASKLDVQTQLIDQLPSLLPQLRIEDLQVNQSYRDIPFDFVAKVVIRGMKKVLLGAVQSLGQPRYLRQAIMAFQENGIHDKDAYFMIAAPYLSQQGLAVCQRNKVGCVDLVGNCYLEFDGIYVERIVQDNPTPTRRAIKSLFTPISSRLIRILLEDPNKSWTLKDLATLTGASVGQTYNVSQKLVSEKFASKRSRGGLTLTDPAGLLDAWAGHYNVTEQNQMQSFYLPELDQNRLIDKVRDIACHLNSPYAFTLHTGMLLSHPEILNGQRKEIAVSGVHCYIQSSVKRWAEVLGTQPVEFGGNVHLLSPYDEGVMYSEQTDKLNIVGNIQLYLDLYSDPVRGRDLAHRLRDKIIGF